MNDPPDPLRFQRMTIRSLGSPRSWGYVVLVAFTAAIAGACSDLGPSKRLLQEFSCDLDDDLLVTSVPPNAIWALSWPRLTEPGTPEVAYLNDDDRVLGVYINGVARAYPHNILWLHEIVNDTVGGEWVSVTFCPLTGSGIAFDPILDGERLDLGVSGLLYANNLMMYDRTSGHMFGPQLNIEPSCNAYAGRTLGLRPVQEMSWGQWRRLHPETKVISSVNGPAFDYTRYPYGDYDLISNEELLQAMPVDRSRPIKERVLAIRAGAGGVGYPYGELAELGAFAVLNEVVGGIPTAVFFQTGDGQAALAFDTRVRDMTLTFDADPTGVWIDRETGSTWRFDGEAIDGDLTGERLATRTDAYTLFWFAWRHFQPDGDTWEAPAPR